MSAPRRVAIVTGGAGGLGSAMVERFVDDGLDVVVADLDATARTDTREHVLPVDVDVTRPEYPVDAWHRVLEVNLFGVFHCTRACLGALRAGTDPRVVNIASVAGRDPNPEMSAYSASKARVIAFTRSMAKELLQTGVLVNCVIPGVVDAGLTHHTATEAERALFTSRVPLGRMGRPEELAELVSWLASARCSFSTGAVFDFSGGRAV
jgi:3-oxoacyl-[acyl-carrier protein] reductase